MADHNAPCGCDESLRLREQNKRLRELLEMTKLAKGQSPKNFDALIDKWLEELEEV